jgi:hypothetical protein
MLRDRGLPVASRDNQLLVRPLMTTIVIQTQPSQKHIGIERLRDPPTEWSRQFEALGLYPK